MTTNKVACVILGGYVNGYAIAQELYENNVPHIILLDDKKDVGYYSSIFEEKHIFQGEEELIQTLKDLNLKFGNLVLYPTQDFNLTWLARHYDEIKDFCFVAFNPSTADKYQDKQIQYQYSKDNGLPCPDFFTITGSNDVAKLLKAKYPLLIKPVVKSTFRNLVIESEIDCREALKVIDNYDFCRGPLLVTEMIPGNGDQIYAYVAYKSKDGEIRGEWTGRKLAQFPNNFGVFSTAVACKNNKVLELGRKLVQGMDIYGFVEPEFKYDSRDGQYKLMEINLRSMMWHRIGALNGMPLHYIQYLDATSQLKDTSFSCEYNDRHFVNLQYELLNLLTRKGYWSIFKKNVLVKNKSIAFKNSQDKIPYLMSWLLLVKRVFAKYKFYQP